MLLEYIYNRRNDNYGKRCVIISRRDSGSGEKVTLQFTDSSIIECNRGDITSIENFNKKAAKTTHVTHPPYNDQIKFHTWHENRIKLKRYLKQNKIKQNDLFNIFILSLEINKK